jgi:hypothetical protein
VAFSLTKRLGQAVLPAPLALATHFEGVSYMCKVPSAARHVKPRRTCHLSPRGASGRYILTLSQEGPINAARLQLFALAYNLGNLLRQLVLPKPIRGGR